MFKTKTNTLPIFSLIFLITELQLFDYMFPRTGFKAIVSFPLIYAITIGVILLGIIISRKVKVVHYILIWIMIPIFNTFIIIKMYPQDGRPSVTKQIKYAYQVVTNSSKVTEDDLEIFHLHNFKGQNFKTENYRERYITALHKYQKKIPRDSSHFLFGRKEKPLLKDTDIKSNLETGQDKLIWLLLDMK